MRDADGVRGRIPREDVDRIRERTDMVEVIGRYLKLERRGNSFVGVCPFHMEKTPSFNVVPQKHMYYCFGCQAGGDVFRFLMNIEGMSFAEAVRQLAGPAGVEIREHELTPEERRESRRKASMYDVLEAACQFYESVLWTRPEGEAGRKYFEKRGLTVDMARKARVGYAPGGWTPALDWLKAQGFDPALAVAAGIAQPGKNDPRRPYDMLRERVVFPIRDEKGRVIAFGGRLLEGDGPKYLNTPDTEVYHKGTVLYGFDLARQEMQRKGRALLVEGYFDVVSLQQVGLWETVAACGTSITDEHVGKLRRMRATDVYVITDSDDAGMRSAEKNLPKFVEAGLQPWRIDLPYGAKDPDELVREHGVAAMELALERRQPLLEWVIERRLATMGNNAVARQKALQDMLPVLRGQNESLISRVAARLGVPDEVLREQVRRLPTAPANAPPTDAMEGPPSAVTEWRPTRDVNHLLWLLVHRYDQVADVAARWDVTRADPYPPLQAVLRRLVEGEPVVAILDEMPLPLSDGAPGASHTPSESMLEKTLRAVVAKTELYKEDEAALGLCEVIDRLASPGRDAWLAELTSEVERGIREGDTAAHRAAGGLRQRLVQRKKAFRASILQRDVAAYARLLGEEAEDAAGRRTS